MLPKRFVARLHALTGKESRAKVQRVISSIVNDRAPTDGTKMVRYSQIKKVLETIRPEYVRYLKVPKRLVQRTLRQQATALRTRVPLTVEQSWIDTIRSWEGDENAYRVFAYLQLVSGRRISEIYGTRFRSKGNLIATRGLKKKRNDDNICTFSLLFDVDPKVWITEVTRMRKAIDGDTLNAVNKTVNRTLKHVHPSLTSHKLRGIYANVRWIAASNPEPRTEYIRESLCLASEDVAEHYAKYNVAKLKIK